MRRHRNTLRLPKRQKGYLFIGARRAVLGGPKWTPLLLYAAGEQGAWYDPSDFSTLFQDSAGTSPVTAVGQPVGKMLDKSGRGNHATQSTAINRPVLSARVNLLLNTSSGLAIGSSGWGGANTGGVVQADGSSLISRTSTTLAAYSTQNTVSSPIGVPATGRIKVKKASTGNLYGLRLSGQYPDRADALINLDTGAVTTAATNFTGVTATVVPAGADGFFTLQLTATPGGTALSQFIHGPASPGSPSSWEATSATLLNAYIKEPHLEVSTSISKYQKVVSAADYDAEGFLKYLEFNGTNSWMSTATIDFTSTNKMTVVAGLRKLSDSAVGVLVELSVNAGASEGSFNVQAPRTVGVGDMSFLSRGTSPIVTVFPASFASPVSAVISGALDIGASTMQLRANGVAAQSSTSSQGTGNYGNYPIYLGARAGPGALFNGRLYSLIIRGAKSSDGQIIAAERFVNAKTGAF